MKWWLRVLVGLARGRLDAVTVVESRLAFRPSDFGFVPLWYRDCWVHP